MNQFTYTHISTLFKTLFPYSHYRILSSLCYIIGSWQLSILYIVMCICQLKSPSLCLCSHILPGKHKLNSFVLIKVTQFSLLAWECSLFSCCVQRLVVKFMQWALFQSTLHIGSFDTHPRIGAHPQGGIYQPLWCHGLICLDLGSFFILDTFSFWYFWHQIWILNWTWGLLSHFLFCLSPEVHFPMHL